MTFETGPLVPDRNERAARLERVEVRRVDNELAVRVNHA